MERSYNYVKYVYKFYRNIIMALLKWDYIDHLLSDI